MTRPDNDELKRLAEGATPGEWTCKEGSTAYPECDDKDFWAVVLSPAGKEVVTLYERSSLDDRADYDFDAAFIAAANPAVVLKLLSEIEGLKAERDRLRAAWAKQNDEVQQALGKALGYPWFKDDQTNFPGATEADGVCVGDHVTESLADEAANHLRTQAPDSWSPDREAVARIISPLSWEAREGHYAVAEAWLLNDHENWSDGTRQFMNEQKRRDGDLCVAASLAKADAILALHPQTAESGK